ncbi:MAG: ADP-ribosylglycohydrolase family protein [Thermoflexaceae bacterium]|nr:ADP-ribosylglycohydrolase family protein [Thermoflexaceae bacterium]
MRKNTGEMDAKDRYIGCIIGGAIGDGMGYAVEGLSSYEITEQFSQEGITEPFPDEETGKALISDDTQMVLFTMDGMMWAYIRCNSRGIGSYEASGVWQSYARWYYTQTNIVLDDYILHKHEHEPVALSSIGVKTILEYEELYSNRNPSEESLIALESGQMGTMELPFNEFKDASCLARVAPVGLFLHDYPETAFIVAARLAAITHGNPTGYLAAGTYSYILAEILNGKDLDEAVRNALFELKKYSYIDEVNDVLEYALHLSECKDDWKQCTEMIGEGDTAEDVLAMAVYCALKAENYEEAVRMAANCKGRSSSIACVCGSLAGAMAGADRIPKEWQANLELHHMMISWIDKFYKLREI